MWLWSMLCRCRNPAPQPPARCPPTGLQPEPTIVACTDGGQEPPPPSPAIATRPHHMTGTRRVAGSAAAHVHTPCIHPCTAHLHFARPPAPHRPTQATPPLRAHSRATRWTCTPTPAAAPAAVTQTHRMRRSCCSARGPTRPPLRQAAAPQVPWQWQAALPRPGRPPRRRLRVPAWPCPPLLLALLLAPPTLQRRRPLCRQRLLLLLGGPQGPGGTGGVRQWWCSAHAAAAAPAAAA